MSRIIRARLQLLPIGILSGRRWGEYLYVNEVSIIAGTCRRIRQGCSSAGTISLSSPNAAINSVWRTCDTRNSVSRQGHRIPPPCDRLGQRVFIGIADCGDLQLTLMRLCRLEMLLGNAATADQGHAMIDHWPASGCH